MNSSDCNEQRFGIGLQELVNETGFDENHQESNKTLSRPVKDWIRQLIATVGVHIANKGVSL